MLGRVAPVRTDVSEERTASSIKVTRVGELGTTLAVISSVLRLLVTASLLNVWIVVLVGVKAEV
jgi:hypothetical protein